MHPKYVSGTLILSVWVLHVAFEVHHVVAVDVVSAGERVMCAGRAGGAKENARAVARE